jgi:hypothetical protein
MAGLVPAIHAYPRRCAQKGWASPPNRVDGRDKPGHDEGTRPNAALGRKSRFAPLQIFANFYLAESNDFNGLSSKKFGNLEWAPRVGQVSSCGFDVGVAMLIFELLRAEVSERGMEPLWIVNLIDEPWKVEGDVFEGIVGHGIDGFDLEGFHEALGLGVVVRIAATSHGADEVVGGQGLAISASSVLDAAIGMVDTAWGRFTALDRGLERRASQPGAMERAIA